MYCHCCQSSGGADERPGYITSLMSKGVKGVYVTTCSEIIENVDKIHEGYYQVVFFSPEALL